MFRASRQAAKQMEIYQILIRHASHQDTAEIGPTAAKSNNLYL